MGSIKPNTLSQQSNLIEVILIVGKPSDYHNDCARG